MPPEARILFKEIDYLISACPMAMPTEVAHHLAVNLKTVETTVHQLTDRSLHMLDSLKGSSFYLPWPLVAIKVSGRFD